MADLIEKEEDTDWIELEGVGETGGIELEEYVAGVSGAIGSDSTGMSISDEIRF